MTGWTGTGRFAERARPFRPIAENRGRGDGRRAQFMTNAAQLDPLGHSLRRHAAKDDLLPDVVCDLGEQDLERTPLILTSRSDMAAINGERDRFRFHQGWFCHLRQCDGSLFQPGADTNRALAGRLHRRNVGERQKLRQQRPGTPVRQRSTHLRDNPLVLWCAAVGHDLADRAQGLGASHSATAWLEPGRGNIHGTEQRHKTSGPLVLDRPRRSAPLASPPAAAMIVRLCLNEMVLQSGEHQLSLCQRQPDGPGRILVNPRAAADLVNADGPIRPGHLHHDPPLHPTPRSPTRPTLAPPGSGRSLVAMQP